MTFDNYFFFTLTYFSVTNKLYVCVARRDDHYVRKEGGKFDAEEFEKHPYRYASTFSQKVDLIYI